MHTGGIQKVNVAADSETSESAAAVSNTGDKDSYAPGRIHADIVGVPLDERSDLAPLVERARKSIEDAVPENTRRAYESDLAHFFFWCTARRLSALPASPDVIALYMRDITDEGRNPTKKRRLKWATVQRACAAVCALHSRPGHGSPWDAAPVAAMRDALSRELGVRPTKKRAIDDALLARLCELAPPSMLGLRDRALLGIGWAGAFRRSELVGLEAADIVERAKKGIVLLVRTSKTDQESKGELVPIFFGRTEERCPVRSLDAWLEASGITSGPIFRALGRDDRLGNGALAPSAVADRVQHYVKLAGLEWKDYGGHSLRRGYVSTAVREGRSLDAIMVITRHRSHGTVRGYIESETLFERAGGAGLL